MIPEDGWFRLVDSYAVSPILQLHLLHLQVAPMPSFDPEEKEFCWFFLFNMGNLEMIIPCKDWAHVLKKNILTLGKNLNAWTWRPMLLKAVLRSSSSTVEGMLERWSVADGGYILE